MPRGTHDWDKFVTPDEVSGAVTPVGLVQSHRSGVVYNPLRDDWRLSPDTGVNYLFAARKAE